MYMHMRCVYVVRVENKYKIQFCLGIWKSLDQCYDFKNIFAEQFSKKIDVFDWKQRQILTKMWS
jgi:hypothetical protein